MCGNARLIEEERRERKGDRLDTEKQGRTKGDEETGAGTHLKANNRKVGEISEGHKPILVVYFGTRNRWRLEHRSLTVLKSVENWDEKKNCKR
eukprot:961223-Amorphochlora_amoeboformis.AAC.1